MVKYGIFNNAKHRTIVFDELIKARRYAMNNWEDVEDKKGSVPIYYHPSKKPTEIMHSYRQVRSIYGMERLFFTEILHIDGSTLYEVNQKTGRVVQSNQKTGRVVHRD